MTKMLRMMVSRWSHSDEWTAITVLIILGLAVSAAQAESDNWDVTQPKGNTRTIDFITNEVTESSVDITPDDQWIVFDQLGHINRVPVGGGDSKVLTQDSGIAVNMHPRVSPDGKEIAFISDRGGNNHIWIMGLDGSNSRQVFDDIDQCVFDPTWTPDGKSIVVRKQAVCHRGTDMSEGLWIFDVNSGSGKSIVSGNASSPSVSPDGKYVYFTMTTCPGDPPGYLTDFMRGCQQIQRVELASGEVKLFTTGKTVSTWVNNSNGGAIEPRVSPDGKWLAFARQIADGTVEYKGHEYGPRTALWLRNLEDGSEQLLMDPITTDGSEQTGYAAPLIPHYSWSSDSLSVVLSQGGKLRRVDIASRKIETIPFKTHVHREISELVKFSMPVRDRRFTPQFFRWATALPDDGGILFQAAGRMWLQAPGDKQAKRVTDSRYVPLEYAPALSPDGKSIAFVGRSEKGEAHIWTVAISGGIPRQVNVTGGDYSSVIWSQNGDQLIAVHGDGANARGRGLGQAVNYQIVSIDLASGKIRGLGSTESFGPETPLLNRPSLLHENRIAFLSGRIPFNEDMVIFMGYFGEAELNAENYATIDPLALYSVRLDGSGKEKLGELSGAHAMDVSPDGRYLAFELLGQIFLNKIPPHPEKDVYTLDDFTTMQPLGAGSLPRWGDESTLEFTHGRNYVSYNVDTGDHTVIELSVPVSRTQPAGKLALVGGTVLTMNGSIVHENATVLVEDGLISCVGHCKVSKGIDKINVNGMTLMPGIVDTHAHYNTGREGGLIPPNDVMGSIYLAYGIITAQDPAANGHVAFARSELIDAGEIIGPRTLSTAMPMASVMPYFSYKMVDMDVARKARWGASSIKSYILDRRDQRQWVAEAARKYGVNVTSESSNLALNISHFMDGYTGMEHGVFGTGLVAYDDAVQFLAQAGTNASTTFGVQGPGAMNEDYFMRQAEIWKDKKLRRWLPWRYALPLLRRGMERPKSDYGFPILAESIKALVEKGGSASLGGHGDLHGLSSHWEIWALAEAMEPLAALQVATLGGAQYLGVDSELGSIEKGKLADILVLSEDPREDICNTTAIRYVMKGGVLYDGETLDQHWPVHKSYGPMPWIDESALQENTVPIMK